MPPEALASIGFMYYNVCFTPRLLTYISAFQIFQATLDLNGFDMNWREITYCGGCAPKLLQDNSSPGLPQQNGPCAKEANLGVCCAVQMSPRVWHSLLKHLIWISKNIQKHWFLDSNIQKHWFLNHKNIHLTHKKNIGFWILVIPLAQSDLLPSHCESAFCWPQGPKVLSNIKKDSADPSWDSLLSSLLAMSDSFEFNTPGASFWLQTNWEPGIFTLRTPKIEWKWMEPALVQQTCSRIGINTVECGDQCWACTQSIKPDLGYFSSILSGLWCSLYVPVYICIRLKCVFIFWTYFFIIFPTYHALPWDAPNVRVWTTPGTDELQSIVPVQFETLVA